MAIFTWAASLETGSPVLGLFRDWHGNDLFCRGSYQGFTREDEGSRERCPHQEPHLSSQGPIKHVHGLLPPAHAPSATAEPPASVPSLWEPMSLISSPESQLRETGGLVYASLFLHPRAQDWAGGKGHMPGAGPPSGFFLCTLRLAEGSGTQSLWVPIHISSAQDHPPCPHTSSRA